jgi:hypothetical protein
LGILAPDSVWNALGCFANDFQVADYGINQYVILRKLLVGHALSVANNSMAVLEYVLKVKPVIFL